MKKLFLFTTLVLFGCTSTGYYPARDMALAEAAVAAAKEVHAERLASDKYQFAVESLGRAKAYEKEGKYSASKRAARAAVKYAEEAEEIAVMKLTQVPGTSKTPDVTDSGNP